MEETPILIMCIRESYEKIRNRNDRLVDVIYFIWKNCTPSMSLEALLIPDNLTDSDSDGIDGGTGWNSKYFYCADYYIVAQ